MLSIDYTQRVEEHAIILKKLLVACSSFRVSTGSSLDPFNSIRKPISLLQRLIKTLLGNCQTLLRLLKRYKDAGSALEFWLYGTNMLSYYNNILLESITLILHPHIKYFREGPSSYFTTFILSIYSTLREFRTLMADTSDIERINNMITNFEEHFRRIYMIENYNLLKYDEARDLLSPSHGLIATLPVDMKDILQKDYFKLTMNKIYTSSILIETYHLSNGSIALFRVNSGELPSSVNVGERLLQRLVDGEYKLLNLGRTLLFPVLRQFDLQIVQDLPFGFALKTLTGNNTLLKITCMDPVKWETHWNLYFSRLFSPRSLIESPNSNKILRKPFSTTLNFMVKQEKLNATQEGIKESGETIVGMGLGFRTSISTPEEDKPNSKFLLRKSNPLQTYMASSLNSASQSSRRILNSGTSNTVLDNDDQGSYHMASKLSSIKLDKSSPDEIKPRTFDENITIISQPELKEPNKQMLEPCDSDENNNISSNNSKHNEPYLSTKKSHSLLGIFAKSNEKGMLQVNTNTSNKFSTNFSKPNTPLSLESSPSISPVDRVLQSDFEEHLNTFVNSNYLPLFESVNTKISYWGGSSWNFLNNGQPFQLTIILLHNRQAIMFLHSVDDIYDYFFAAEISQNWKFNRSTAQDIQLRIPSKHILKSIVPIDSTINIRCSEIEHLIKILNECMKVSSNILSRLDPAARLSSPLSLNTHIDSGLSTRRSIVSRVQDESSLLVSNVKVKHHIRDNNKWYPSKIGVLNVYLDYISGSRMIRFEFSSGKNDKIDFISEIGDIRRIGRTGVSFVEDGYGQLLEFTNQNVADEVYKLFQR